MSFALPEFFDWTTPVREFGKAAFPQVSTHEDDYNPNYNYDQQPAEYDSNESVEVIETLIVWGIILLAYIGLMILGFFAFPPFIICLAATGGMLDVCSFDIWAEGPEEDNGEDDYQPSEDWDNEEVNEF